MLDLKETIEAMNNPALLSQEAFLGLGEKVYNYYTGRVEKYGGLHPTERTLLAHIEPLPVKIYHDIGGGIGFLAIALGLMGKTAVNIDSLESCIKVGNEILETIDRAHPGLRDRVRIIQAEFPKDADQFKQEGAYAITMNVAARRPDEFLVDFCKTVQRNYAGYIFDICLLWNNFQNKEEWKDHLAKCVAVWGREPELLFNEANYCRYYIVKFD